MKSHLSTLHSDERSPSEEPWVRGTTATLLSWWCDSLSSCGNAGVVSPKVSQKVLGLHRGGFHLHLTHQGSAFLSQQKIGTDTAAGKSFLTLPDNLGESYSLFLLPYPNPCWELRWKSWSSWKYCRRTWHLHMTKICDSVACWWGFLVWTGDPPRASWAEAAAGLRCAYENHSLFADWEVGKPVGKLFRVLHSLVAQGLPRMCRGSPPLQWDIPWPLTGSWISWIPI